ncbi:hypothetical protein HMPREF1146_2172 [Prevotella sp. MSX73]|nr:hypothetical protein HMPREF1146_2172 [Prevotella sp. MSX73]
MKNYYPNCLLFLNFSCCFKLLPHFFSIFVSATAVSIYAYDMAT